MILDVDVEVNGAAQGMVDAVHRLEEKGLVIVPRLALCPVSSAISRQHLELCSGIAFSPQNRYLCTIFFHLTSLMPRLLHKST